MNPDAQMWGGWGVAIILGLFTLFTQLRKGKVDESALVLGKWKELVETHEAAIAALRGEFAAYKKEASEELEALRKRLRDVEKEFADYKRAASEQILCRDREIEGLKRAIAQNSKSAAYQIGRIRGVPSNEDSDTISKLDKAGDNSMGESK
jgi:hypothetical protein